MALNDPFAQSINGVNQLVSSKLNKTPTGAVNEQEGVEGEFIDELSLDLDDSELLALSKKWELLYAPYESKLQPRQQANITYYLGKQKLGTANVADKPISANLIFEAVETFIPAALSKNPEPVVWADNTEIGNKMSNSVKTMLQYHADTLGIRPKLSMMTRKWLMDLLGVLKFGWDDEIKDLKIEVRDAKNFIFDPNGYVDCYGDFVGYLGERITVTAEKLIELFPKHKEYIAVMADGKLGTECIYTEWWTDKYCFYTFKGEVLDKHKNPNFNYDVEEKLGENDIVIQPALKGKNHFAIPKKPYIFLSVFNMGNKPHDETSLIEQNIPNQDRISRRTEQIDYNLSKANNSDVFSENNFNQETAKQAALAMAKGHPVLIPAGGPIANAVNRLQAPGIGSDFFNELQNSKNDLRSIFGTQGITPELDEDQTARGMILNQQYDNSRIGGGIGDKLEGVAKAVFNWLVQGYYVYYDEQHFASIMGRMRAVEYVSFNSTDLGNVRMVVSVAPDSMKPKDEVTEMNEAMSLYEAGALDPKTLLTIRNFPDPQKTAAQAVLWKVDPQMYIRINFPELAAQIQQAMAPMGAPQGAPGGVAPEQITEPAPDLGGVNASAALSNVPLPTMPQ